MGDLSPAGTVSSSSLKTDESASSSEEVLSTPNASYCSSSNGISWISSAPPKNAEKIPYVIQIAHSYTIKKLKVQLAQLVSTADVEKQKQLRAQQQQQALRLPPVHPYHQAAQQRHPHHYSMIAPHPHSGYPPAYPQPRHAGQYMAPPQAQQGHYPSRHPMHRYPQHK